MTPSLHRLLQPKILCTVLALSLISASSTVMAKTTPEKEYFQHVSSFDVMAGNGSSVAEIVDAAPEGTQLVYTDSDNQEIGFVKIANPAAPVGSGTTAVGGEPTSLAILKKWVLVAVNTSVSNEAPSGKLVVVNRRTQSIVAQYELGGQPDSIAIAPDQKRAVIVLENERNEDLNNGIIPQNESGKVLVVLLDKNPKSWTIAPVDLSKVAAEAFAGSDLEPEFVDINKENEAVVSFQENNHLAVVDIVSGSVINHFSAGSVVLENVDTIEDDLITLESHISKRREPDAVAWIDNNSFATANEGDYEDTQGLEGGSRGFTIFNQDGTVEFESNSSFEHLLVAAGHYNEARSANKGIEPEAVEFGIYDGNKKLLFVGSERSNAVGVYEIKDGTVTFQQILPTGIRPEGLKAIPKRNLFVASTEKDVANAGIPAMVNIYQQDKGPAYYPMITSKVEGGDTLSWVALSGLAGDPFDPDILYAVNDSFLAEGYIYTIDVSSHPAIINKRLLVTGATSSLDLEGIAVGPDGNFWVASEGKPGTRPNAILKIDPASGKVAMEIHLPPALEKLARKNGFEGIAVTGKPGVEIIYVAIQRAWPDAGDIDTVNTKIGRYDVAEQSWSFVHYPLEQEGGGGWIGLSELTLLPNGDFAVIERDKGWGTTTGLNAELKAIYTVNLASADFRPYTDKLATLDKHLLINVLPELENRSIWTPEKLEGYAVAADGQTYSVTDNDGIDDAPGETLFFELGNIHLLPDE